MALTASLLAGCSSKLASRVDPKYGVSASPRVIADGRPVPKGGGVYRVGKPYTVGGRTYVPAEDPDYSAVGLASWYGDDFHGRLTANGEVYDMNSITAAHPTLPLPSYVRVTNLSNRRSIVVRVNDRGPYHGHRIIDLSARTAKLLGFRDRGIAKVKVEYVGRAPLDGSDDRMLLATLRDHGPAPAPGVMLASAKPFLPHAGRPGRAVPVPDGRPYALGEHQREVPPPAEDGTNMARASTIPARATSHARRVTVATIQTEPTAPSTSRFDSRWQGAVPSSGTLTPAFGAMASAMPNRVPGPAATPRPVSAYAPARYDASPGYVTGRGLY